ncbi:MAG: glycosyltransferase 61 family protein [Rhodocyclaceae bacterium]
MSTTVHTSDLSLATAEEDAQDYARAEALFAQGNADAASAILLEMVERNTPRWEPYNDLGVYALSRDDAKTAHHFLRLAVAHEQEPGVATGNLANALLSAGKDTEAVSVWAHALKKQSANALAAQLNEFLAQAVHSPTILPALIEQLRGSFASDRPSSDGQVDATPASRAERPMHLIPMIRESELPEPKLVFAAEAAPATRVVYHFDKHDEPAAAGFPAINRYALTAVVTHPRADTFLYRKNVVVSDHFDHVEHLLYDTAHGHRTPLACGGLCSTSAEPAQGHLKQGVLLTSYACVNWAHFLTELLPIAALVEYENLPLDIPLVISDQMHPNMLEMIKRVKAPERRITTINGPTSVSSAVAFSPAGTGPFDYARSWKGELPRKAASDFLFSPSALRVMRDRLQLIAHHQSGKRRKIFASRRSKIRQVRNWQQLEEFFSGKGFEIVRPEELDATQQLALFAEASIIVGQSGAGIANMVFSPTGCRVVVFTLNSPFTPYAYFTNLSDALGHEIHYLGFQPIIGKSDHPGHDDMIVDIETLNAHAQLFD